MNKADYKLNSVPDMKLVTAAIDDIRLVAQQRSSLDDPAADKTVTIIQPNSKKEEKYSDFLVQKKVNLVQLNEDQDPDDVRVIDITDPNFKAKSEIDKTVGTIPPNSEREEKLANFLVEKNVQIVKKLEEESFIQESVQTLNQEIAEQKAEMEKE